MVKAEIYGPDTYDSCMNRVRKLTGILLIFHPGCGHCVQMRPEWEKMKQRLSSDTKVVEIDGSAMSENSSMTNSPVIQRTRGFPSIFRVKDGNIAAEYQGERTAEEMHKFASEGKKKKKQKTKLKKRMKKSMRKSMKNTRRKLM
jgi:thioredoxin-like negative regulator of GroEL